MADLNSLQATEATRIIGSDSVGAETYPVKSYNTHDLGTSDIIDGPGLEGAITVNSTSAIELKVGASALVGRKYITLFNNSNKIIYWGRTSSVTILTGTPIFSNQFIGWRHTENAPIWLISDTDGLNARITENKGNT
jgi:hypothetical protein